MKHFTKVQKIIATTPYGQVSRMTNRTYGYVGCLILDGRVIRKSWSCSQTRPFNALSEYQLANPGSKIEIYPVDQHSYQVI